MPTPPNSVAVAAGSKLVEGHLVQFVALEGDQLVVAGYTGVVKAATSGAIELIHPWAGPTLVDRTDWHLSRTGPGWASVVTTNQRLVELITKIDAGLPFKPDATGTFAQRAQYDGQAQGFSFLRTDVDPFVLYVKAGPGPGSWSQGVALSGRQGDPGPGSEFRVNPATFAIEHRPAGGGGLWVPVPGGDLDDIVGPFRLEAAASAGAAAASAAQAEEAVTEAGALAEAAADAAGLAEGHATTGAQILALADAARSDSALEASRSRGAANEAASDRGIVQFLLGLALDDGDQDEGADPDIIDDGDQP